MSSPCVVVTRSLAGWPFLARGSGCRVLSAKSRLLRLGGIRRLPRPGRELPDLQRTGAIPDEPVDIPRAGVGKPELHGFAVRGAARLREDPAPAAFLYRKRDFRDGGSRDLRARKLRQPASVRLPADTPALLLRGRIVRRDRIPDSDLVTSSSAGPPLATPSRSSTITTPPRESAPRTPATISPAAPAPWCPQRPPGLNDHDQVAHWRLHRLADLCRRQDVPDLEGLG